MHDDCGGLDERVVPRTCGICGSSDLREHTRLKGGVQVMVCAGCGTGITSPLPVAQYDDHSFFTHAARSTVRWRRYSGDIVRFLARHGRSTGRLLDVGSSHGLLLEEATLRGWHAEGVEPSRSAVEHSRARGLAVTHGYLQKGIFPPGQFDAIVISHVIEHVHRPCELLVAARELLRPGGVICLCQTNYEGTVPRVFGRRWDYWVEHEHYYHFSRSGIEFLLRSSGLKLQAIELLPLGYDWRWAVPSPRAVPGAVLGVLKTAMTRLRAGLPYVGDQMYVLAGATSNTDAQ